MLRFSDSKLGGISTAYASQNDDGTVDVKHLEPDTLKILQVIYAYLRTNPMQYFRYAVWQIWSKISLNYQSYFLIDRSTNAFLNFILRNHKTTDHMLRKHLLLILKLIRMVRARTVTAIVIDHAPTVPFLGVPVIYATTVNTA